MAAEFASKFTSTIVNGTSAAIDRVMTQFRRSGNLDLTIGQFQQIEFAASQTGMAMGQFEFGMRAFQKALGDATFGNKQALQYFQALNIDVNELAKSNVADQIQTIGALLRALRYGDYSTSTGTQRG